MKVWKKIVGITLVILFTYIYAHVAKTHVIYDGQMDSRTFTQVIEQEFVCETKSLDAIAVKCQIDGAQAGAKIRMTLTDVEESESKATVEIETDNLESGKYNSFVFDKIEGCKGKRYKVSLESTEDVQISEDTLSMKTVTKGFDIETFCVLLFMIFYILFFFKFLIRLFSR